MQATEAGALLDTASISWASFTQRLRKIGNSHVAWCAQPMLQAARTDLVPAVLPSRDDHVIDRAPVHLQDGSVMCLPCHFLGA